MAKANINERYDKKGQKLKEGERVRADGRYEYRYVDPSTFKRKSTYANSLFDLRRKIKVLQESISYTADVLSYSLNDWFELYIKTIQIEPQTLVNYRSLWKHHVEPEIGRMQLTDIKASHIKTFYAGLTQKGYSVGTLKIIHGILCPVFNMALDDEVITKNPALNHLRGYGRKERKREALTADQQKRMFDFAANSPVYKKHLPLLTFMVETALRVGELAGLTWDNIDRDKKTLTVDHQLIYKNLGYGCEFKICQPKTESGIRVIPLTEPVLKALTEVKKQQFLLAIDHSVEVDGYKNFIFTSINGNPYAPNALNHVLYGIVNAYNKKETYMSERENRKAEFLPKISCHIMRHTGCTRMAERGMDPKVLQYIMGHADFSITMNVYNHVSDYNRIREEVERVERHTSEYMII